ncbi:cob(I)yrinic acid a,c-diamide adenosyltransferase [Cryobacterium sp. BB307]|uniref:cob(I)yrinic acid a,c-diamide adenosyltransferase n=1 Tax=Cryobacterium sp. BB307 TaxID=2716317 RepID=UPI0014479A16|nr:cob(I)yrinic acid a,c-diamide adenosyltransferase [Cryobacterium sp. BB307]
MSDAVGDSAPRPEYQARVGDDGRTVLGRHGDVPKFDPRVAAWGDCDEANAAISVALAVSGFSIDLTSTLASIQNDLFDLVTDLAVPLDDPQPADARIHDAHLVRLERAIEHFAKEAPEPAGYVLPVGTVPAATLYQARAVVRRAERTVWMAIDAHPGAVNVLAARYLNRLSTLLFAMARGANIEHGDVYWEPEATFHAMEREAEEPIEPLE